MGSTQSTKSAKKQTQKRCKNNKVHPLDQTPEPSLSSCDRSMEHKRATKCCWWQSVVELHNIKSENKELKSTLTQTEGNFNICCHENDELITAQNEREEQWQGEKTIFTTQLKMYKQLCMSQTVTLKKADLKYKQDKAGYLQTIEDLRNTLQRKEQEWERKKGSMKAELEQHRSETRKMESDLREAEGLETEIIQLKKDLISLLTDMGVYSQKAEANDLEISNLTTAVREAKQKLSNERLCWEEQKKCHFEELEQLRATHEAERNNIKSENEELQATLAICCLENDELTAAHREAEEQWQEEKDIFMTQLKLYKQLCMSQTDTQKWAHLKYEDDKAGYLQTTVDLRNILRRKEQEWERTESSMKAQLEQQRSEIREMEAEFTDNLKTEILHLQKEITSLLIDMDMSTSSHVTERNNLGI